MNLQKISPKLFAGVAVLGTLTTAILAARETPKAVQLIEASKAKTFREKAKACWKCYIPAGASCVITVASIIGGFSDLMRKNTELALAYGIGQTAIRLYSERTPAEVRQEIGTQMMHMHEPETAQCIQSDPGSDPKDQIVKFYDYMSNQEFYDTRRGVENAIEEFTETVLKVYGYGSLNQLYSCFHNDAIKKSGYVGDVLGWKYVNEQGPIPLISPDFDKYGNPCIVLDYVNPPIYDFTE